MNNFDTTNYELGSSNALQLQQRMQQAGVWRNDSVLSLKMLRHQLHVMRMGDLAELNAYGAIVNHIDEQKVRQRYWHERAARLCQDRNLFSWPSRQLTISEACQRLQAIGIDPQIIADELEQIVARAKDKRNRIAARKERREQQQLKEQKIRSMLKVKYETLKSRVLNEHSLNIEYLIIDDTPRRIKISWWPDMQAVQHPFNYYFSVKAFYLESQYAEAFPAIIEALIRLNPLGQALFDRLVAKQHHLSFIDGKLEVMSGSKPRLHHYFNPAHHYEPEQIVTEGPDVELAARFYEQLTAAGLSLFC